MPRLGSGVREPAEPFGVGWRTDHEADGDPQDDERQNGDSDRLVDEQDLRQQPSPRQLRRPDAEAKRGKDERRHQQWSARSAGLWTSTMRGGGNAFITWTFDG